MKRLARKSAIIVMTVYWILKECGCRTQDPGAGTQWQSFGNQDQAIFWVLGAGDTAGDAYGKVISGFIRQSLPGSPGDGVVLHELVKCTQ